jgi:hypothetical protein
MPLRELEPLRSLMRRPAGNREASKRPSVNMICRKLLELGLSPSEASRKVCGRVYLGVYGSLTVRVWVWLRLGSGSGVFVECALYR